MINNIESESVCINIINNKKFHLKTVLVSTID